MSIIPVMRPLLGPEEAAAEAVASGWVAQGPRVAAFERAFVEHVQAGCGVARSSCTAALHVALVRHGVGPGDEVVIPSLSSIATANAVRDTRATPAFADIDLQTGNLTAKTVDAVRTAATRAVLVVHQAGVPADLDELRALCDALGLPVLEDGACAAGSTYRGRPVGAGSLLAAWSFHPRKLLTTGEGGMLTVEVEVVRLREHGMSVSADDRHALGGAVLEIYLETGFHYRLTDIEAAVGLKARPARPCGRAPARTCRTQPGDARGRAGAADGPRPRLREDGPPVVVAQPAARAYAGGRHHLLKRHHGGAPAAGLRGAPAHRPAPHRAGYGAVADPAAAPRPDRDRAEPRGRGGEGGGPVTRPLVLIKAGGLASGTAEAVRAVGDDDDLVGFARVDDWLWGTALDGLPVLGGPDVLRGHDDWRVVLLPGSGAARGALAVRLGVADSPYAAVVNPRAAVPPSCTVGAGPFLLVARESAALLGVRSCIGIGAGNGTDAIELALRACGIGAGDEVVLPAHTFVAPAEAVTRAGAVPVLADVDKDCLLLDPESVASVVGPATRALVPVHLFGQTAPVERLADLTAEHGLVLIEDAVPQDHHPWSNDTLYGVAA